MSCLCSPLLLTDRINDRGVADRMQAFAGALSVAVTQSREAVGILASTLASSDSLRCGLIRDGTFTPTG
jgi:hypothetical protein